MISDSGGIDPEWIYGCCRGVEGPPRLIARGWEGKRRWILHAELAELLMLGRGEGYREHTGRRRHVRRGMVLGRNTRVSCESKVTCRGTAAEA